MISVILTCWNEEKYIGESIQSLLDQTYEDLEIIVVDDMSTDGTPEILRGFDDDRLVVITTEHPNGRTKNMNVALNNSKGDFIATQGSDDISEPTRFEEQLHCFTGNIGVVTTYGIAIDPSGKRIGDFYMDEAQRKPRLDILAQLYKDWWILGASLMFKKECFDKLGPFDQECYFAQDLNMWYRVIEDEWDWTVCGMELYRNRRHPRKDKKNYDKRKNTNWHKLAIDKAISCPIIKSI